MKILIVYAHPEPRSFNGALKDTAVATFGREGHEVVVSDLYAMGWKPALQQDDSPARASTPTSSTSRPSKST